MSFQAIFERLELKYLISEATALAIVRAIEPHCGPDVFNGRRGRGYHIGSLYLDSPDLAFFWAKERGHHDRVKLRCRIYDDTGPVNLEIKRKRGDVVWKQRAAVPRSCWSDAALGFAPEGAVEPKHENALDRFARLAAQYGAEPKLMVEYEREAYAARSGEYARVTFDRTVRVYPTERWCLSEPAAPRTALDTGTTSLFGSAVVLELKTEQYIPTWMSALIHDFELNRVGYSKYNTGMRTYLDSIWVRDPMLREMEYA